MQKQFRAIVVDDMELCTDLLTDFLRDRGYQVVSFSDVTACPLFPPRNAQCPTKAPCADFYLTDNRMPHMQGLDFLELQEQGKCRIRPEGKAIFSAHWTPQELDRAKQLNCKIFFKPYDLKTLGNWLDEQEKKLPAERTLTDICNLMGPSSTA